MPKKNKRQKLEGNVHAILLVVHNDEYDDIVSHLKHDFEDLITTHLHSKIEGEKCMELFVIDGESSKVQLLGIFKQKDGHGKTSNYVVAFVQR